MSIATRRINKEIEQLRKKGIIFKINKGESGFKICLEHFVVTVTTKYPFQPPTLNYKMPCKDLNLDPFTWCFTILHCPEFKQRFPSWRINCLCCHSLTCIDNWTIRQTIEAVILEGNFLYFYNQLKNDDFTPIYKDLPIEILEYIVFLV